MIRTLHVPRSLITPTTPLDKLIHSRTAGSQWSQLRDAAGARKWPPLVRARWMSWLVHGLPLLAGTIAVVGLPWLAERAFVWNETLGFVLTFVSGLRAFVAIPFVILSWVLLARVSKRFHRALPHNIRTIGDLIPFVLTSGEMSWTHEQIEQQVCNMVVNQLHVPTERYRAEARFVEEPGREVGLERL